MANQGHYHRFSGLAVQTAAVTLKNATGRLVHLIGVSHVANHKFWTELNLVIHRYDSHGWQIHYERVKPMTSQQLNALAPEEREILDGLNSVMDSSYGIGQSSKLMYQGNVLELPPTAINTDTDLTSLVRALAQGPDVHMMKQVMAVVSKLPQAVRKTATLAAFLPVAAPNGTGMAKIIKDDRNDIALSEIDKTSDNVLMLWGAAHLPGICQGLSSRGFRETDRQWHTVFTVGELYAR